MSTTKCFVGLCCLMTFLYCNIADGIDVSQILQSTISSYGKLGIGPCPVYTPMVNFNASRVYGGKWYVAGDYSESHASNRHCTEVEYSDVHEGEDDCRMMASRTALTFDGEVRPYQFIYMLPNITDPSNWVEDYRKYSSMEA